MANLILWRHADAEMMSASGLDIDRALTPKGEKDAAKMAQWLSQHLPNNCQIFTSPAKRCVQTTNALIQAVQSASLVVKTLDDLKVDASAQIMLAMLLQAEDTQSYLIIGHQPNLGEIICCLIGMQPPHCVVKKGAIWWIKTRQLDGVTQRYLHTLQQPRM